MTKPFFISSASLRGFSCPGSCNRVNVWKRAPPAVSFVMTSRLKRVVNESEILPSQLQNPQSTPRYWITHPCDIFFRHSYFVRNCTMSSFEMFSSTRPGRMPALLSKSIFGQAHHSSHVHEGLYLTFQTHSWLACGPLYPVCASTQCST